MSTDDTDQPVEHGVSGLTIIGTNVVFESYPKVLNCPACGYEDKWGQSFDIFVCRNCGKWSGIDPIEK